MVTMDTDQLEELYDLTPEPGAGMPPLNSGLTEEEIEEAPFYDQLRIGVMAVSGEPGAGKGVFLHFLLWKLRTLFRDFHVLLDKKPRPLFDESHQGREYLLINRDIVTNEFNELSKAYKKGKRETEEKVDAGELKEKSYAEKLVDKWIEDKGDLFYNAGMGLDEFWEYFDNRNPHNIMCKTYSPLLKRYRHYNLLVIGATPHLDELDVKKCLKYVTHEVRCNQTTTEGVHVASIFRHRFFNGRSIIEAASQPITLIIDAKAPRDRLGGKCIYDLYNSYERGEFAPRLRHRV